MNQREDYQKQSGDLPTWVKHESCLLPYIAFSRLKTMSLQGLKTLIVEDDPIICEHINQLLKIEEAVVLGYAHRGVRALDMIHNLQPDFVICDIHLEDHITGIEIAKILDAKYSIPYIFLTSYDDGKTVLEAQKHSPYGYIVKPFQDRTLLTTIKIAVANFNRQSESSSLSKEKLEEAISTSLTDQEYSIFQKLYHGASYANIAEEQHLSKDSIKYHAGKIYAKCKIKGRSELAGRFANL